MDILNRELAGVMRLGLPIILPTCQHNLFNMQIMLFGNTLTSKAMSLTNKSLTGDNNLQVHQPC